MKKEEKAKKSSKFHKFESLRNLTTVTALQSPGHHHPLLQPEGAKYDVKSEIDPSDAPISSQIEEPEEKSTLRKLDPSDAPISSQLTRHTVGSLANTTLSRAAFKLLQDVAELRKIQRTIKLASQLSTRIQAEEKSPKSRITTDILKQFLKKKLINNNTDIDLYVDEPGDEFKNLKDKIHATDGLEHAESEGAIVHAENVDDVSDNQPNDDIMNIDNIQSLFRKHHTPREKKKLKATLKSAFDKMQTDIESTASVSELESIKNESDTTLNPLNELLLTYLLKHDKSLESYTAPTPSTSRVDDIDMADDALVVKPEVSSEFKHVLSKNNASIDDLDMKDDAERKSPTVKISPSVNPVGQQKRKMNETESYIDALLKGVQSEVLDIKNYSKKDKEDKEDKNKEDEQELKEETDEVGHKDGKKPVNENEMKTESSGDEAKSKVDFKDDADASGSGEREAVPVKEITKESSGEEKEAAATKENAKDDNGKEEKHYKINVKEVEGKADDLTLADAKPDDKEFEAEVAEILDNSKLNGDTAKDDDAKVSDVKQILEKSKLRAMNEERENAERANADDVKEILEETDFKNDTKEEDEAKVADVKQILEKSQHETSSDEDNTKVSDVQKILSQDTVRENEEKDLQGTSTKKVGSRKLLKKASAQLSLRKDSDVTNGNTKPDEAEESKAELKKSNRKEKSEPNELREGLSKDSDAKEADAERVPDKAGPSNDIMNKESAPKKIKGVESKDATSISEKIDVDKAIKQTNLKKSPTVSTEVKVSDTSKDKTNRTDNVKEENSVDTYIDESETVAKHLANNSNEKDEKETEVKDKEAEAISPKQGSGSKEKKLKVVIVGKDEQELRASDEKIGDHTGSKADTKQLGVKVSEVKPKKITKIITAQEEKEDKGIDGKETESKEKDVQQSEVKEPGAKPKKVVKIILAKEDKDIKEAEEIDAKETESRKTDAQQSTVKETGKKPKKVTKIISAKVDKDIKDFDTKEDKSKVTDAQKSGVKAAGKKPKKVAKVISAKDEKDIKEIGAKENESKKADAQQSSFKEVGKKPKKVSKTISAKADKNIKEIDAKENESKETDARESGAKEAGKKPQKVTKIISAKEDNDIKIVEMKNKAKALGAKQSGAKESDAKQKKTKKVVAASKSNNKEKETKLSDEVEDAKAKAKETKTTAKENDIKDDDVKADIMKDAEKALAKDDEKATKPKDRPEEATSATEGESEDVKVVDTSHNTESFEDILFTRLEELKSLRKLKRQNMAKKNQYKKKTKHHKRHHRTKPANKKKDLSKYFRLLSNNSEIDQESLHNLKIFHDALKKEDSKSNAKEDFAQEINRFNELQKEASDADAENGANSNAMHDKNKKVYYLHGNYTPIYFMKQLYANKFDDKVNEEKASPNASPNTKAEDSHESLDVGLMPFIGDKDLAQEPPIFDSSQPQQLNVRGSQPEASTTQSSFPTPQVSQQYAPVSQVPGVSQDWQSRNMTSVAGSNSTIGTNDVRTNLIEDVLDLLHKSVKERKEKLKKKKKTQNKKKKKGKKSKDKKHQQRKHFVKKLAKLIVDKEQEEIKQLEIVRDKLKMVKNATVSEPQSAPVPQNAPVAQNAPVPQKAAVAPNSVTPGIILDGSPLTSLSSNSETPTASISDSLPTGLPNSASSLLTSHISNPIIGQNQGIVSDPSASSPFASTDNADLLSLLPNDITGMTMTAEASLFDTPTPANTLPPRIPFTGTVGAGANPGSALYNSYLDPLYPSKPFLHNYSLPSQNVMTFQEQQRKMAAEGCNGGMVYGKRCIPSAKNAYIGLGNPHHINEAFVKHDPNSLTALEPLEKPLEKQFNYGVTSMFDMPMISPETGKPIDVSLLPKYKLHGEENVAKYVTSQARKDAAAMLVAHAQQMYGKTKTTPASGMAALAGKSVGGKSNLLGMIADKADRDTENLNKAISMYNNALKTISGIVAKYNKTQTEGGPLSALQKPIMSPLLDEPAPSIEQLKSFSKATAESPSTSTTESPLMNVVGKVQNSDLLNLKNLTSLPSKQTASVNKNNNNENKINNNNNNNKISSFESNNMQESLSDANLKAVEKPSNSDSAIINSFKSESSPVNSDNTNPSSSGTETPPPEAPTLLPASNDPSNVERSATEMPTFDLNTLQQTSPEGSESHLASNAKNNTMTSKSEAPSDVSAAVAAAAATPHMEKPKKKPHNELFTTNIPGARVALPQIPKEHDEHLKTLFPYNAYYPRAPPIKMSRAELEGNHFKAEYTKYKLGLKRLSDIIGKYTYKLGKIPASMNAFKTNTNSLVSKLATDGDIFGGTSKDDVTNLGTFPPLPFTYSQLAKPSNAMLQYLTPTEHQTVRRTLSPTNDMLSKHFDGKNAKTAQTLEDELKSISSMLEKSLSYQPLPDQIISQFTGDKGQSKSNTPYPVTQMGKYAIRGYKRHNEMVVPEWANPLKRPSPPGSWDEQYADNVKYLKLLQGDMQSSVNRFNQDIIKQQKMNQSQVDTSKKYPFKFPEDELDRLNKDPNSDGIETDITKYMVGAKESSSLLKNISSYPFVDNDNATVYPIPGNDTTTMMGSLYKNVTQNILPNITDVSGTAANDSAFADEGSGADVAQVQYFSNDDINKVDEENLPLNKTAANQTLIDPGSQTLIDPGAVSNSTINDVSQRHMDGNVNVKGNMDQLKSLMDQMQQDIDNANTALNEQNQKKLEEKIIEDKERKEKDAKEAAEAAESDQRHTVNNTESVNANTSTDNLFADFSNNTNNNSNDSKDLATETYTKDEANETSDVTGGTVKSDLDKVKALITQMQADVFNTNAAIYAQGHQNPWPTQLAQSQIQTDIFNTNAALYKLKQSIKKKPKEKPEKVSR